MIPSDVKDTLIKSLAFIWVDGNHSEQCDADAALDWLENHQDDGKYFIDSVCSKVEINFCPICGTELGEQQK